MASSVGDRIKRDGWIGLTFVSTLLVFTGFFMPWIDHPAAGLALTGFEVGEWIKFAPDIRAGTAHLRRAGFYWPATTATAGLASVAIRTRVGKRARSALVVAAVGVALLPFPLIEEVTSVAGLGANWDRIGLILVALTAIGANALVPRRLLPWARSGAITGIALVGYFVVRSTFAGAEPIVERLYNRLIDPGSGFVMVQIGQIALIGGGIWHLASRERKKGDPNPESPFASRNRGSI